MRSHSDPRQAAGGRCIRIALATGFVGMFVAGCGSIGPASVPRDRIDYAGAIADSWKQQTLLNVVRLRYADAPTFMDVSSIIASYAFIGNVNAGVDVNLGLPGDTNLPGAVGSIAGSGTYLDRPTLSYTPLTGDKFARSLLRPIPPNAIFTLIASGYPADFILQVTVRALSGVYNRSNAGGAARPADPEFYAMLDTLRRIQLSGAFSLRLEKRGADDTALIVISGPKSSDVQQDIALVRRVLSLAPEDGEIALTYGAVQRSKGELAVLSRSMIEILRELAANIETPPEHAAAGRTFANVELGPAAHPRDQPVVRIHAGATPPTGSFAAVPYQGTWYWIDDGDYASKHAFTSLLLFFALAETGVQPQAPLLTLPLQ